MPTSACPDVDRSAEWRKWTAHYKAKGLAANKLRKMVCKRMGYR